MKLKSIALLSKPINIGLKVYSSTIQEYLRDEVLQLDREQGPYIFEHNLSEASSQQNYRTLRKT